MYGGVSIPVSSCIVLMCVARWNLVFCLGNADRVTVIMPHIILQCAVDIRLA